MPLLTIPWPSVALRVQAVAVAVAVVVAVAVAAAPRLTPRHSVVSATKDPNELPSGDAEEASIAARRGAARQSRPEHTMPTRD